jgi:hypothetical protein
MGNRKPPHAPRGERMTKEQVKEASDGTRELLSLFREKRNTVLAELNAEEERIVRTAAKQDKIDVDAGWRWDRDHLVWKLPSKPAAK